MLTTLQTLLPLTLALVEAGTLTLNQALAALTSGPAAILGLQSGSLSVGSVADLCIFDPEQPWTLDGDTWLSEGRNTPYWGQTMKGRVTQTFLGGARVFELNAR